MKTLQTIDRALARFEGWLIVLFLSLMVGLTFLQVMLRALYTYFNLQWANALMGHVDWAEPFVRLLVLWVTFLGASLLTGDGKHIKIDLMSALLPTRTEPYRDLILSLVCVIITGLMVVASVSYIKLEFDFGGYLFLRLPNWVGQLILPAGFALIFFRFLLRIIEGSLKLMRGADQ